MALFLDFKIGEEWLFWIMKGKKGSAAGREGNARPGNLDSPSTFISKGRCYSLQKLMKKKITKKIKK